MRKKSQITMESLLLYGVAILVVLLAIAALTYYGVLDLGRWLPQKCNLESGGVFKCEEWQAKDGAITVVVKNTAVKSVELIGEPVFISSDTALIDNCATDPGVDGDGIASGGKKTITWSCQDFDAVQGDRIKGQIRIVTRFGDGTLETTTVGDLVATVSPS